MLRNDVIADQFVDQFRASVRDGVQPPDGPPDMMRAAAVRAVDTRDMPPALRRISDELMREWSEELGVTRPEHLRS